jgi:hypothetical protein
MASWWQVLRQTWILQTWTYQEMVRLIVELLLALFAVADLVSVEQCVVPCPLKKMAEIIVRVLRIITKFQKIF